MLRVLVSGCFDLLHMSHIVFLKTAALNGQLRVLVGSDANICRLKGQEPVFTEDERVYRLNALSCVHQADVASGAGYLDFVPDLDTIKPDVFIVAEDGDSQEKRAACESRGIRYLVILRGMSPGSPAQSSTAFRALMTLPYRLCLAGGWIDQPWMSARAPGSAVVVQIEADPGYREWCGLATSTRKMASQIWGGRIPAGDVEATAKLLFACENPPGCKYISGSQDAIGIVFPGISRLDYSGEFWPTRIQRDISSDSARWLERVIKLVAYKPRPKGYDPLLSQQISPVFARVLGDAGRMAWAAIVNQNIQGLAVAMNDTMSAWEKLLPLTVSRDMHDFRQQYSCSAGSCFTGAGGGYLMVVSSEAVKNSTQIHVRNGDT